jgi:hypothetical protein
MSVPIVPTARSGKTGKVVTAREAARLMRAGDTVAIGGFFGIGLPLEDWGASIRAICFMAVRFRRRAHSSRDRPTMARTLPTA